MGGMVVGPVVLVGVMVGRLVGVVVVVLGKVMLEFVLSQFVPKKPSSQTQ
jgi:hypothetical protein